MSYLMKRFRSDDSKKEGCKRMYHVPSTDPRSADPTMQLKEPEQSSSSKDSQSNKVNSEPSNKVHSGSTPNQTSESSHTKNSATECLPTKCFVTECFENATLSSQLSVELSDESTETEAINGQCEDQKSGNQQGRDRHTEGKPSRDLFGGSGVQDLFMGSGVVEGTRDVGNRLNEDSQDLTTTASFTARHDGMMTGVSPSIRVDPNNKAKSETNTEKKGTPPPPDSKATPNARKRVSPVLLTTGTSFKEIGHLLFDKFCSGEHQHQRRKLESRFWGLSADSKSRAPVEVSRAFWATDGYQPLTSSAPHCFNASASANSNGHKQCTVLQSSKLSQDTNIFNAPTNNSTASHASHPSHPSKLPASCSGTTTYIPTEQKQSLPELLQQHVSLEPLHSFIDSLQLKVEGDEENTKTFDSLVEALSDELSKLLRRCHTAQALYEETIEAVGRCSEMEAQIQKISKAVIPSAVSSALPLSTSILRSEIEELETELFDHPASRTSSTSSFVGFRTDNVGTSNIVTEMETDFDPVAEQQFFDLVHVRSQLKLMKTSRRKRRLKRLLDEFKELSGPPKTWMDGRFSAVSPVAVGARAIVWDGVDLQTFQRVNIWKYKLPFSSDQEMSNLRAWSLCKQNWFTSLKQIPSEQTSRIMGCDAKCDTRIRHLKTDPPTSSSAMKVEPPTRSVSRQPSRSENNSRPLPRHTNTTDAAELGIDKPMCIAEFDDISSTQQLQIKVFQPSSTRKIPTAQTAVLLPRQLLVTSTELTLITNWGGGRSVLNQISEFGAIDFATARMYFYRLCRVVQEWESTSADCYLPLFPSRVLLRGKQVFICAGLAVSNENGWSPTLLSIDSTEDESFSRQVKERFQSIVSSFTNSEFTASTASNKSLQIHAHLLLELWLFMTGIQDVERRSSIQTNHTLSVPDLQSFCDEFLPTLPTGSDEANQTWTTADQSTLFPSNSRPSNSRPSNSRPSNSRPLTVSDLLSHPYLNSFNPQMDDVAGVIIDADPSAIPLF